MGVTNEQPRSLRDVRVLRDYTCMVSVGLHNPFRIRKYSKREYDYGKEESTGYEFMGRQNEGMGWR